MSLKAQALMNPGAARPELSPETFPRPLTIRDDTEGNAGYGPAFYRVDPSLKVFW